MVGCGKSHHVLIKETGKTSTQILTHSHAKTEAERNTVGLQSFQVRSTFPDCCKD